MSQESRLTSSFNSPGSWSRRSVMFGLRREAPVQRTENGIKKTCGEVKCPCSRKKVEGWALALAWLEGTGPHPLAAHPCRRGEGAAMTQR